MAILTRSKHASVSPRAKRLAALRAKRIEIALSPPPQPEPEPELADPTEEQLAESEKIIMEYCMGINYQTDQREKMEEAHQQTLREIEEENFKTECWQFEQVHNLQPLGIINRLEFESVKKLVAHKERQRELDEERQRELDEVAQAPDGSPQKPFILE